MPSDDDDPDDHGAPPSDDELRPALRALRGDEGSISDILTVSNLAGALPGEVMDALSRGVASDPAS